MPIVAGHDSAGVRRSLTVNGQSFAYYSIPAAEEAGLGSFARLPAALKVVLENLLRFEDGGFSVSLDDIRAFGDWAANGGRTNREINYRPARVLMQDFTGVPAVVDLAAMRDGIKGLGGDAQKINPLNPVDLVIDHSFQIDEFGNARAFQVNVEREYERNMERYEFLKWGQTAFNNFRVVPPGTGICHQVNLEYLSQVVWTDTDQTGEEVAYPDTLVGTDSHTTMVNGAAVLGWGVGGIEAEAAMLGQPVSMLIPEVVGFKLTGRLREGTTATDLVLKVVQMLRKHGVVGKFVEFYGEGLDHLPLADRATIGNMAPEYGATCGFFPVDQETLRYLRVTGRDEARIALVEAYAKENGFWRDDGYEPIYSSTLSLDMGEVVPAISGPKRPQDHTPLAQASESFFKVVSEYRKGDEAKTGVTVKGEDYTLSDGSVVIASITSCTNTSNPYVMIGAGLVARKARQLGLNRKPWVKTSLAPGSQVVSHYLEAAGLQEDLDAIGFNLVGYGCATCIGNSGPLQPEISDAISANDLVAVSVLSGNRNFEGTHLARRGGPTISASPPLVVVYALAGDMDIDVAMDPIARRPTGRDVYLKTSGPAGAELPRSWSAPVTREGFQSKYADVFKGDERWQAVSVSGGETYDWPGLLDLHPEPALFPRHGPREGGDSNVLQALGAGDPGRHVTTDHISPAGSSRKRRPPDATCRSGRCQCGNSTPTARGGATTR
jgi:aconitate hydratase